MAFLDKRGAQTLNKKDRIILFTVYAILYLILFAIIYFSFELFVAIGLIILISAGFTFFIITLDKNNINENLLLLTGISAIPFILLAVRITLLIVPYRGEDLMIQRKSKLKFIIRKTKYKKIKFWEK